MNKTIISIITKTKMTEAEIAYMKNLYGEEMDVIPISDYHVVIKSVGLYSVEAAEFYMSLSATSISEYFNVPLMEEICA